MGTVSYGGLMAKSYAGVLWRDKKMPPRIPQLMRVLWRVLCGSYGRPYAGLMRCPGGHLRPNRSYVEPCGEPHRHKARKKIRGLIAHKTLNMTFFREIILCCLIPMVGFLHEVLFTSFADFV